MRRSPTFWGATSSVVFERRGRAYVVPTCRRLPRTLSSRTNYRHFPRRSSKEPHGNLVGPFDANLVLRRPLAFRIDRDSQFLEKVVHRLGKQQVVSRLRADVASCSKKTP